MSETFILTFKDLASYEKGKEGVVGSGGTIKKDFGTIALGFSAAIPPTFVELIRSGSLVDNGIHITSFESDSKVTIQAK